MQYNLKPVLSFLKKIKTNNNRIWFNDHKNEYENAIKELSSFADLLLQNLRKHDDIETSSGKKSLFRIYNDVRFSKSKLPYKVNLGGGFKRATVFRRGGYYFHIEPNNSFVAGGFWGPNAEDLHHIRKQIASDPETLQNILNSSTFKNTFGHLLGEKIKTAPRGYTVNDPAIELLRYKQFILRKDFDDEIVSDSSFHHVVSKTFLEMRPFFDYMSDILTTDLNGNSLFEE